ncbi:MAG: phospholipid/glycerol acyltransferase [Pseudonocardiales bacterium]|nr:phospholipid/glycerol acyltransferase [Pseudonocardiales bacterium]
MIGWRPRTINLQLSVDQLEQAQSAPRDRVPARALQFGLEQLVRRGLRGVWLQGEMPAGAFVWAANHHSWWDGFVASSVLKARGRRPSLLMDGDNLSRFNFLESIGVIPTARPRAALDALRAGRVLILFPEAELRAPGEIGPLARGATWIAERAPAPLIPVSLRVIARGHEYPEAYIRIGPAVDASSFSSAMSDQLARLDADLRSGDPRQPLGGFQQIIRGRSSWDERIARLARSPSA